VKDKLKNMFTGKRKNENLVVLLVLVIIVVISINYIWKGENNKKDSNAQKSVTQEDKNVKEVSAENTNDSAELEKRLENILSKISGVGETKVMITYAESSSFEPVYDENIKSSNTVESDKSGGTRSVSETNNQKQVIYKQNSDGSKEPITKSLVSPKIEGAIIAAKGASNDDIKAKIIEAVGAATGISAHKIQVFEME
jgi:stage III sporulation protein AG